MSKTAEIRQMAKEYLYKHGILKRSEFISYLRETGVEFTEGHIAASLSSLPDDTISRIETGVYQLNDWAGTKSSDAAAPSFQTVQMLHSKVNSILDKAVDSLKALATVNFYEVDQEYITELEKMRDLISTIEDLKKQ